VPTTTARKFESRPTALLVVPGFETFARFPGGEDVDQAGMTTALCEDLGDPFFRTETFAFQILNFQTGLAGQQDGVVAHLITQRFGQDTQIKAADVQMTKLGGDGIRMPDIDEHARDDQTVVAPEHTNELIGIPIQ
jgi:hypothetical protein